jgi:hypothetical protein
MGSPDPKHTSTSFVERQNLTMRMSMRRFTRLTNGFSKKLDNHAHQVALYFMHYNYCRIHKTLRVTPAMEAGLTNHVWTLEELCGLIFGEEADPTDRRSNHQEGAQDCIGDYMAKADMVSIPYLDPSVQHVGISKLHALNVTQLRDLDKTLVIQDNDKPLAVLLKL